MVARKSCCPTARAQRITANLVLGPDADCLATATTFNYRSSWPSIDNGYWFDDESYFTDVQSDDQFYFDRFGAFYRSAESVRTAVVVR